MQILLILRQLTFFFKNQKNSNILCSLKYWTIMRSSTYTNQIKSSFAKKICNTLKSENNNRCQNIDRKKNSRNYAYLQNLTLTLLSNVDFRKKTILIME